MIKSVYGVEFEQDSRLKRIMEQMNLDSDGEITHGEWIAMTKRQPILLYPAFTVQNYLRRKVVGNKFWEHISRKRQKHFPGATDIWEILNDENPWENFRKAREKHIARHVPERLKPYVSREEYIEYKLAEKTTKDMIQTEIIKEKRVGFDRFAAGSVDRKMREGKFTAKALKANLDKVDKSRQREEEKAKQAAEAARKPPERKVIREGRQLLQQIREKEIRKKKKAGLGFMISEKELAAAGMARSRELGVRDVYQEEFDWH